MNSSPRLGVIRYFGTRYDFVINYLREQAPSESWIVADVGAGDSRIRKECPSISQFLEYDLLPKSHLVSRWNVENPCPDDIKADVVILMDVIEHLWNPGIGIENITKILRLGGTLLLSTPNPSWSRSRVQFPFRHTISCFTESDLDSNHHVFTPWHHVLMRLLDNNGYEVEQHVTLESSLPLPNIKPIWTFPLRLFAWAVAKVIEFRNPTSIGSNYLFVARKISE